MVPTVIRSVASRRQTLKVIGVGTGAVLTQGVMDTDDNDEELELDRQHIHLLKIDLNLESIPNNYTQISGPNSEYPFITDNEGKIFVSQSNRFNNLSEESDLVIASTNGWLVSKNTGDKLSFGRRPITFGSNGGYISGKLQTDLDVLIEKSSNSEQSESRKISIIEGEESHELKNNEEYIVDGEHSIEYRTDDGDQDIFTTQVRIKFVSKGRTQMISHPEYKLIPASSQSAMNAEKAYNESKNQSGVVEDGLSKLNVKKDARYGAYLMKSEMNKERLQELSQNSGNSDKVDNNEGK